MKEISFTIPIIPKAQMRARHFARPGKSGKTFSGTYKDEKQQRYEVQLMQLLEQYRPEVPMSGAIELKVVACLPIPQTKPNWWHKALFHDKIFHTSKPDIDNLLKNLLDCMEKIGYFKNDSQIFKITIGKRYHEIPSWIVQMREISVPKTKNEYLSELF